MEETSKNNGTTQLGIGAVSGSRICPNCEKEHDSNEWNGCCSKRCWWGFPVDCH